VNSADRVIGFDLSIVATGVALPDGNCYTIRPKRKGDRRLSEIREQISYYLDATEPALAVIEQIAEGSQNSFNTVIVLAMVHGQVRGELADRGIPFAYIRPTTLKKWATGSGRAEKVDMVNAALDLDGEPANGDEADAWWCRAAGRHYLGHPVSHFHTLSEDLILGPGSAVKWPDMNGARAAPSRAT
jgi:crossover junction endodeoxyribonuclease RuvC